MVQRLNEKSTRLSGKQFLTEKIHHLTDDDILDSVAKLPVAQLMTQDCKDLWVVASLFLVLQKYL